MLMTACVGRRSILACGAVSSTSRVTCQRRLPSTRLLSVRRLLCACTRATTALPGIRLFFRPLVVTRVKRNTVVKMFWSAITFCVLFYTFMLSFLNQGI